MVKARLLVQIRGVVLKDADYVLRVHRESKDGGRRGFESNLLAGGLLWSS